MKTIYHVPTEQFGFIEVEKEDLMDISPEAAKIRIEAYRALSEAVKAPTDVLPVGLLAKEWNAAVDEYLKTGTLKGGTELYNDMNDKQKFFFQTLKMANKRIGYRNEKDEDA